MKQLADAWRLFAKGTPWDFIIFVWLIRRRPATRLRPQAGLRRGIAELCRTKAANPAHFSFNEIWMTHDRRGAGKSSAMRATANNRRAVRMRTSVSRIATDLAESFRL
ncbi:MAG: hypothetical protein PHO37_16660 [Kiritimatiellae bacterium]|nr:hypothetical protein [Kiritimatiellia bacterium]